jgi:hypothetical protein
VLPLPAPGPAPASPVPPAPGRQASGCTDIGCNLVGDTGVRGRGAGFVVGFAVGATGWLGTRLGL